MTHTINDHYRTLELPPNASPEDIRIRYLQMARVYHPDRYNDPGDKEFVEAMMKRINEAYYALTHPTQPTSAQSSASHIPASKLYKPVYKTVKGVPPAMSLMLAGIAFILGAITVQFFNFMPLSDAISSNLRANSSLALAKAELQPVAAVVIVTHTTTSEATATPTVVIASQTPIGEPLAMAANGVTGAFPQSSKTKTDASTENKTETVVDTATPQPTDTASPVDTLEPEAPTETVAPTSTATPTHTVTPTETTIPTETATTPPSATPSPQPTNTPVPTDTPAATHTSVSATEPVIPPTNTSLPPTSIPPTPAPPAPSNAVTTQNGVLLTISVEYNVFARTDTSIQSEAAGLLSIGDQVLVIGRTIDNYWLRILLSDGRQAWVYAETVGIDPAVIATLPVVSP